MLQAGKLPENRISSATDSLAGLERRDRMIVRLSHIRSIWFAICGLKKGGYIIETYNSTAYKSH